MTSTSAARAGEGRRWVGRCGGRTGGSGGTTWSAARGAGRASVNPRSRTESNWWWWGGKTTQSLRRALRAPPTAPKFRQRRPDTHTHAHKNTSQERPPQPFLLCAICYDTFSSCSHLRRRASQSEVGGASSVLSVNETQNVLIDDGLKCERGALGAGGGGGGRRVW